MKHFLVLAVGCLLAMTVVRAQSDKYQQTMEATVAKLDATQDPAAMQDLSNSFERVAKAEKDKWLPYYYAAYSNVMAGYMMSTTGQPDASKTDPLADKADEQISKAAELAGENSEIYVVKKMINTMRMMADPQSRYMQYGPLAAEALEKAKALNPDNPRVYLLEAQDKFYTPEQFGGSKEEAKKLFEKAKMLFEKADPASPIDPHWGASQLDYFMSQF